MELFDRHRSGHAGEMCVLARDDALVVVCFSNNLSRYMNTRRRQVRSACIRGLS